MKIYNIIFRNGESISLQGDVIRDDKMILYLWKGEKMVAAFSWDAIAGFTITEGAENDKE